MKSLYEDSIHSFWHFVLILLSGASSGFFIWSFTVGERDFNSYIFANNLSPGERIRLGLFLSGCALFLLLLWYFLSRTFRDGKMKGITLFFTFLLPFGFWPILAVKAIEVYYPYYVFFLIAGVVVYTLFIGTAYSGKPDGIFPNRNNHKPRHCSQRLSFSVLVIAIIAYAVFFSIYTVMKHRSFHSYAFDLGWQNQAFHTLLKNGIPRITILYSIDHFSSHFQPIYYLLVPFYAIFPKAEALLVMQSFYLSSAAVPIYLLARKKTARPGAALVIALVYLLYPPLHGMNTFDYHGLTILIPMVCFLLYALEVKKYPLFWVLFALALAIREDTAVSLSGVGLYMLFNRDQRRRGLVVLAVCLIYFGAVLKIMSLLGSSANLVNYWSLTLPEQENFVGVLITVLTNPQFIFRYVVFDPEKIMFLLQVLFPLIFLPLLSGRKIVMLFPGLAIILLSNTHFNFSIGFAYSAHIIPYLFFLAICSLEDLSLRHGTSEFPVWVLSLLLAGVLMNYEYGLVLSKRFPGFPNATERQKTAFSLINRIPKTASVAASNRLVPHLSGRDRIHLIISRHDDTEYILVDLDPGQPATDLYEKWYQGEGPVTPEIVRKAILNRLDKGTYGVLGFEDHYILLKRGYERSANLKTAAEIRTITYGDDPLIIDYYRDPSEIVNEVRYSESERLRNLLRSHSNDTVILVADGNVTGKLTYNCAAFLVVRGSEILKLRGEGGYLAIMHKGELIAERLDNESSVELDSDSNSLLRSLVPAMDVSLYSPGPDEKKRASINISGQERAADSGGLYVVVLDYRGRIVVQDVFKTGK